MRRRLLDSIERIGGHTVVSICDGDTRNCGPVLAPVSYPIWQRPDTLLLLISLVGETWHYAWLATRLAQLGFVVLVHTYTL